MFLHIIIGNAFKFNLGNFENLNKIVVQTIMKTSEFIQQHQHDDIRKLALQAAKYPDVDFPFALRQIAGRQIAAIKIPSWYSKEEIIYPPHLSLEQCSSEITALYKASLFQGKKLVDLTGGFGIDCSFLSPKFREVAYVERQPDLCEIALSNFKTLSLNHVKVYCMESGLYLEEMDPVDCIYLDPARRDKHGKKTVSISDCEPDVERLKDRLIEKAQSVWVKFSPMLDISLALTQLPMTTEIHVVAVDNECKELLFKMEQNAKRGNEPVIYCVNLKKNHIDEHFSFTKTEENNSECCFADLSGSYLYEPNAAILKAGAYKCLTQHYPIRKLHPNSHLYTSDTYVPNFPGRSFCIIELFSLSKQESKQSLSGLTQANITVRNFPLSVNELRKKTGLKEGGEIYLFATTLWNEKRVLIKCKK